MAKITIDLNAKEFKQLLGLAMKRKTSIANAAKIAIKQQTANRRKKCQKNKLQKKSDILQLPSCLPVGQPIKFCGSDRYEFLKEQRQKQ